MKTGIKRNIKSKREGTEDPDDGQGEEMKMEGWMCKGGGVVEKEGRIPALSHPRLPLTTPWYQEWCLLLLTLLNHFQCYFLCVYKTVNHTPFGVGGYGLKYGGNIQDTGKRRPLRLSQQQLCSFLPHCQRFTPHTHLFSQGIDGDATVGPSVFITLTFICSDKGGWVI